MPSSLERSTQMWNTTRAVCGLAAAVYLIAVGIVILQGQSPILNLAVCVVSALIWLAMRRPRPGAGTSIPVMIFLAQSAVAQYIMWNSNELAIRNPQIFEIFTGYRISAVIIGLIAPPVRWLGWLLIIAYGVAAVSHYYTWDVATHARIGVQEPWMTVMYVVASGILYNFRVNQLQSERKSATLQERVQMLSRFAHIVVNTQHQVNTPLQTIENSVNAIRKSQPELLTTLNLIDRSMERIRSVMKLFSLADANMVWKEEVAPFSTEEFQKLIHDLNVRPDQGDL